MQDACATNAPAEMEKVAELFTILPAARNVYVGLPGMGSRLAKLLTLLFQEDGRPRKIRIGSFGSEEGSGGRIALAEGNDLANPLVQKGRYAEAARISQLASRIAERIAGHDK